MYNFNYRFDSVENVNLVFQETRNRFFVFHNDSSYGWSFFPDKGAEQLDQRLLKDSMLFRNKFETSNYDSLANYKPDSIYYDNENHLVKMYHKPFKKEYIEDYYIYLFYSAQMTGINESLSSMNDNVSGRKLFRITQNAKGGYYEEYKTTLPERNYIIEMKKIPVPNTELVKYYFSAYLEKGKKKISKH